MKQLCPKCECGEFQLQELNIANTSYHFMSIQCKHCGYPIGVTTLDNVPELLREYGKNILDRLDEIERKLNH